MRCAICGLEVETIDEAIEQDWFPSFYDVETEHGPVCSSCADQMITTGVDGGRELKAEYRGKVHYMDGDYSSELKDEDLVIEIFMTEERKEQSH